MKPIFIVLTVLLALPLASGMVVAQADTPTVPDGATTETQTQTSSEPETVERVIDPVTRVVSSEYQDGQFVLVIEADVPQLVTLSGSVDVQEGWQTYATKSVTVPSGSPVTVRIAATADEGAATVALSTQQCRSAGRCPILSSGERSSESPFAQTGSTAGWLGGLFVTCTMVGIAAWRRKNRTYDEVEEP